MLEVRSNTLPSEGGLWVPSNDFVSLAQVDIGGVGVGVIIVAIIAVVIIVKIVFSIIKKVLAVFVTIALLSILGGGFLAMTTGAFDNIPEALNSAPASMQ